jgi:hypothetical protein
MGSTLLGGLLNQDECGVRGNRVAVGVLIRLVTL